LPHITPTGAKEWGAVLPQYAGLLVLIFSAVFWALTGRLEPALLAAALLSRDVAALLFVALLVVPATLHLARR
jgi:hypothetical protein